MHMRMRMRKRDMCEEDRKVVRAMKMSGIFAGKRRCFLTLLVLYVMLACPGRAFAAPPIFRHGQVKASDLAAFQNRAMYIDGAFLTIVMDADLSLQRIQPTSEYMDCNLTVTGNHTLTVNSYDLDLIHGWKDDPKETPMAVKAGNMVFENTTVNAKGIWYSLFAFGDLRIINSRVKSEAANADIFAGEDLYIRGENSVVDCMFSDGSNGLHAGKSLFIEGGTVNAQGRVLGINSNDSMQISGGKVKAKGEDFGILSGTDLSITGGTVEGVCTTGYTDPELKDRGAGIFATGMLRISDAQVTASGVPNGISSKGTFQITDSLVDAAGTVSAVSVVSPILLGPGLTVLKPAGGKTGKTDWNPAYPYGVVTMAGKTAAAARIGKISEKIDGTVTPEAPVNSDVVDKKALSQKNEKDVAGSTFGLLQARGKARSGSSIRLSWQAVPGATRYVIYGNKCGARYRCKNLAAVKETGWTQKKLKKGTYYKYIIVAVDDEKTLAVSKTVHVVTNGGSFGNHTKVTLNKKKLTLKVGKSKMIKAVQKSSRRVQVHRKVAFESSDPAVAKVSPKGKVKAVSAGTCVIYVYAQNGVKAKVTVTVN